jgi:hypothetical protein
MPSSSRAPRAAPASTAPRCCASSPFMDKCQPRFTGR